MKTENTLPTGSLLDQIKKRFYDPFAYPKKYYQERKMLLYAITWPAKWLEQRALPITARDYQKLITQRLDDIARHGDPQRVGKHFPTYLLKTIQDWFHHHADELYEKLKHIRNQLTGIETLLAQNTREPPKDIVTPMAQAHAVLASQYPRKPRKDTRQLNLF